jgi:hypothetical protein
MFTKTVLASILCITLTSCTSPKIKYDQQNTLGIVLNEKTIVQASGNLVHKNRVNLSNINIYQKVFVLDSGTAVTYEDVRVSSGYKLTYGINQIIGFVFTDYNYEFVQMQGNLHYYKLHKNNEVLYVILENINKKGLHIIYGISESTFNKLQKAITANESINEYTDTPKQKALKANDYSNYIKSNWNTKNIIFDNIVSRVGFKKAMK